MAPPARTIIVALDMSKAFDTINIHTLIRKLLQTNIPGIIIKLIANYIRGRNAYTTYRNHTSKQRQFKTGVPQGGVLSPTHIHNISVQAHKPLQIIKALTATGWGKQKETLMATYKAFMRPALEYASSAWSHIASSISINKLQVMQNAALRTATGCTQDTDIQHLHDETLTIPIHEHLQLHASQYKQKTQHPSHPLHKHTPYFHTPRLKTHYF